MASGEEPEARAEGEALRLRPEAKRKQSRGEAKRMKNPRGKSGSTVTFFKERSLYRFEGLKARSGPGRMRVCQAISNGGLAQLGERVLCKHEVIGSSPIFSTVRADSSAG